MGGVVLGQITGAIAWMLNSLLWTYWWIVLGSVIVSGTAGRDGADEAAAGRSSAARTNTAANQRDGILYTFL